ncbi:hypothetical protein BGX38DRAFT_1269953 [Terfezia claveryi]|nr:hypothetical protein BGX38DRAFT_1269953 [Terfezia claveryi]
MSLPSPLCDSTTPARVSACSSTPGSTMTRSLSHHSTEYSLFLQNPDKDTCIFDRDDQGILQAAMELVRKLKQRKYFTDTKRFTLRYGVCGLGLVGEDAARAHARKTGHTEFGEF